MQVLGHRGSRCPGPENTVTAVRAALGAGADGSEVDVRRTSDGKLVCIHDPFCSALDRPVIELTAKQLAAAGVPSLEEVLAAAVGGRMIIEVKNDPREPDFSPVAEQATLLTTRLARLAPQDVAANILISSFDPRALGIARAAGWPVGLLTAPGIALADGLAYASGAGYQELHAHVSMVTESADLVQQAGLALVAWTVTTAVQALGLRDLGVDGVICDDPALITAALAGPADRV